MTDDDLGSALGPWLEDAAGGHAVTYLGDVLGRTARTRQRPAWSFPGRWLPAWTPTAPVAVPRLAWQLLVLGLLLALLAGIAVVGSRRPSLPTGLGRPGLIALDTGHHIAVVSGDGAARRMLTSGPEADAAPTWSPDGMLLAFWRASGIGHWQIVVMDADGRARSTTDVQATTPLPYPSGDPRWSILGFALGAPSVLAWSPDSTRLAFSQDAGGMAGVWVVNADGSGLRRLGDPSVPARDPAWSPDGTRIAFHGGSEAPGGGNGVWVMGADGSDARRITSLAAGGKSFEYPHWQPGGELIAFSALPNGLAHVFVAPADGSGELDLSASPDPSAEDWLPTWSPDGSRIAWVHFAPAVPGGRLVVGDPDGGRAVIPPGQPDRSIGLPMWAPDGRSIAFLLGDATSGVPTDLMSIDVTGTRPPTMFPITDNAGGTSWQRLPP